MHDLSPDQPPDFMASSLASVVGNRGYPKYVPANLFMAAIAK
jgi:hypothetical protein